MGTRQMFPAVSFHLFKRLSLIAIGLFGLSACSTNPVTGKNELSIVSESWELNVGQQQYSPSRQSQGGDYVADPKVQAYVNEIGQKLARVSDRQLPYEFHVINNSIPNAWALPGGKIAINRGLLTEMQSEAELAAVLGHEIVHAAARHGAKGMQRGLLLQGGVLAASIAAQGSSYANLAQMGASIGAQLINTKYGRDAERESDHYGMNYMSRAGYDPQGAVDLQKTFVKISEGRRQDFLSGMFASHPPSQERVVNNTEHAATLPQGGEVGRDRYQQMISHLVETKPAYDAYEKAQKSLVDGNHAEASRLTKQAIAIEPKEGHFHSLLGDIEHSKENYKTARGYYDKAISLNNNFFYYYLQNGLVSEKLGDAANAKRYLERSLQLLPTANAYNSLGNISRTAGQNGQAKQYYAKAAQHQSPAGQAAFASLVELDLPTNPGAYIKTRYGLTNNATIQIQISNTTPRDVSGIVIALQYPDNNGNVKQLKRELTGRLAAGQNQVLSTQIQVNPKLAGYIKAGVIKARLVK